MVYGSDIKSIYIFLIKYVNFNKQYLMQNI